MNNSRQRYLEKRTLDGPWRISGTDKSGFAAAVVVPACDEEEWIFATLQSLAANPAETRQDVLVLVVVNHPPGTSRQVEMANRRTLEKVAVSPLRSELNLGWVDACSKGHELPNGGVGGARKIGFDLALSRLRQDIDPVLVALDADTLVEPNYLSALRRHFDSAQSGAAVIPFSHQAAVSPARQAAIDHYELYLRCYVLGLKLAGSPYAFHTVGSAMACRASAYVRCGGMNQKKAAEDFYFLQALAKTDGISQITGTTVHPSARLSTRVPFGTGPSVRQLMENPGDRRFYPATVFDRLGDFLRLVAASSDLEGNELQAAARQKDNILGRFLEQQGLAAIWNRLCCNHRAAGQTIAAFHGWFDALKTLKLLKYFCQQSRSGPVSPAAATSSLFPRIGLSPTGLIATDLDILRRWQNSAGSNDKEKHSRTRQTRV